jgi:hypothetical protein
LTEDAEIQALRQAKDTENTELRALIAHAGLRIAEVGTAVQAAYCQRALVGSLETTGNEVKR